MKVGHAERVRRYSEASWWLYYPEGPVSMPGQEYDFAEKYRTHPG